MRMTMRGTAAAAAVALCTCTACYRSGDEEDDIRLVSIQVTPPTAIIGVGRTQQFAATGLYSDGASENVTAGCTWTSSDEANAIIDAAGLATGLSEGEVDVTCTFDSLTDTATLTVASIAFVQLVVSPPNAVICVDGTAGFTARAVYDDASGQVVTDTAIWTSADPTIATVSGGIVTGVASGTTTIAARFVGLDSNEATVVVTYCDYMETLEIFPNATEVALGETLQYTAIGTWNDGTTRDVTRDVTWDSSDAAVATIDATGLATGVSAGTTEITATLDGIVSSHAVLTVPDRRLIEITLDPVTATLCSGSSETTSFTATGLYTDGSTADLTARAVWLSDDETVATVSNEAGSHGVVSPDVANTGAVEITAVYDGITSAPAVVAVTPCDSLIRIDVEPLTATLPCGGTIGLTATTTYLDGGTADVTALATWTSSDESVATVSGGVVAGVGLGGTATITATLGGVSGSAAVLINCDRIVSIMVTPSPAPLLPLGSTQPFAATAMYTDGSTADVTDSSSLTWSSSNRATATISNDTGSKGIAAGIAPGTTNITARYTEALVDVTSVPVVLVVSLCDPVGLRVLPASATVAVGSSLALRAESDWSCGLVRDDTDFVSWSSSDETAATVTTGSSPRGVVTGVAAGGPVTITASWGTWLTAIAEVTVVP